MLHDLVREKKYEKLEINMLKKTIRTPEFEIQVGETQSFSLPRLYAHDPPSL